MHENTYYGNSRDACHSREKATIITVINLSQSSEKFSGRIRRGAAPEDVGDRGQPNAHFFALLGRLFPRVPTQFLGFLESPTQDIEKSRSFLLRQNVNSVNRGELALEAGLGRCLAY